MSPPPRGSPAVEQKPDCSNARLRLITICLSKRYRKSSCHERHTHRTISTNDERTNIDEGYRTHRTISTNEQVWIKMSDGIDVLKKSTSSPSRFHGVVYSVSRLFPAEILLFRLVENFNSHLLGVRTLRH